VDLITCINCGELNSLETEVCICGYWIEKQMVLPGPSDINALNKQRWKKKILKIIICSITAIVLLVAAYMAGLTSIE
jgi:hypothetical protein